MAAFLPAVLDSVNREVTLWATMVLMPKVTEQRTTGRSHREG